MKPKKLLITFLLLLMTTPAFVLTAASQEDDNDPAKATTLIRDAIKARGGETYLAIRNTTTRGQYTQFLKGVPGDPNSFVDYIVYPDRERTEFGKGNRKYIQTNSAASGWIYDAAMQQIREQTEEQVKSFQQSIRHDLDNLLRLRWQEPGVKLVYLGRREPWKNTFSEAVRLDFADGSMVTLHFDARTKLPMMSEYQTVEEGRTVTNQARFFRWAEFSGIKVPTFTDFYREGQQSGRASFDEVIFNTDISEKLFAKPLNIKEVK